MKTLAIYLGILVLLGGCSKKATTTNYSDFVDPFVGAADNGHCMPGACFPFGLIQAGPESGNCSWDYTAGYQYKDSILNGFSQTRLSGTGCSDLGDLLMLPFSGNAERKKYQSGYKKENQVAYPGYYSVLLSDFDVKAEMTEPNWKMYDQSQTNAEIILKLYQSIREGTGENYIIGCNTISHLSAGIFELNRIGDDTSGNEWERTRGNGVNTLAFRGVQQGTFYSVDADCVGLTVNADWEKNKQWMELVAKSGTPLFISAQPEAIGTNQNSAIKECFSLASQELPLGEPLDWMERKIPNKWKLNGKIEIFNWD
ncbi:MAG: hypothetical protein JJE17_05755 [Peptostreptococcaceae bacterium]|nr:hypothetical protein [Peptostreptococcaceae bacterium]